MNKEVTPKDPELITPTPTAYRQVHLHVLGAHGFVGEVTGQYYPLNAYGKLIYSHLKQRKDYFDEQGQPYYQTHASIANDLGMSRKTVWEVITLFIAEGVVNSEVRPNPHSGLPTHYYLDVHDLITWRDRSKLIGPDNTFKPNHDHKKAKPKQQSAVVPPEDIDEIPFR